MELVPKDEEVKELVGDPQMEEQTPPQPEMSEMEFKKLMKEMIGRTKLRHELIKLEAEMANYELARVQATMQLAQLQAPSPENYVMPEMGSTTVAECNETIETPVEK